MPKSLEYIHEEILRVADELGIEDPRSSEFTRTSFLKRTNVSKHDLEVYGGFSKLKVDAANAGAVPSMKAAEARGVEIRNSYVRKLEKTVATSDYFHSKLVKSLDEVFSKNVVKLSTAQYVPRSKKAKRQILNLLWSDLHLGVDVKSYETMGSEFTWQIASRRLAKLCQEAVIWDDAAYDYSLRLYLNGDIFEGVIHLNDSNVKPMTEQIWGACAMLTSAIDFLRKHFIDVTVICLPGNHDRMTYRGDTRVTSQRWDSHAHSLYLALKMAFRNTDVKFDIPTLGLSLQDDLNDGYILATHGDVEPDPKNVSKSIDTERLQTRFLKMKDSEVIDRKISVGLFGHWHTPTIQMLPSGSFMVVNGCLIGSSPYGQNVVGEYNNTPAQVMFDTIVGNPFNRYRIVTLRSADKDSSLDKIVPTPEILRDGQLVA